MRLESERRFVNTTKSWKNPREELGRNSHDQPTPPENAFIVVKQSEYAGRVSSRCDALVNKADGRRILMGYGISISKFANILGCYPPIYQHVSPKVEKVNVVYRPPDARGEVEISKFVQLHLIRETFVPLLELFHDALHAG